ncbi:hypothetical protein SAMN05421747_13210 [Parapedobacter composti]|uniref:Uncharacterized protein n=1 Tax=Parapedobacter composti TaxID=623281 RepID=A0A1I1MC77_9SPHI|nr:hypothetical protein SAMN05421747_13210 [Parapedobacter composti]
MERRNALRTWIAITNWNNEAGKLDGRSFGYNTQVVSAQTAGGIVIGWAGAQEAWLQEQQLAYGSG